MGKVTGAQLMARSLKQQGVEHMFGIVGFPVQPIAAAAQSHLTVAPQAAVKPVHIAAAHHGAKPQRAVALQTTEQGPARHLRTFAPLQSRR